jgi:hypothetical protein
LPSWRKAIAPQPWPVLKKPLPGDIGKPATSAITSGADREPRSISQATTAVREVSQRATFLPVDDHGDIVTQARIWPATVLAPAIRQKLGICDGRHLRPDASPKSSRRPPALSPSVGSCWPARDIEASPPLPHPTPERPEQGDVCAEADPGIDSDCLTSGNSV